MVSGLPLPARRLQGRSRAPVASERPERSGRVARPPERPLRVDDHVVPSGADWELIRGRRVKVMPADPPHSDANSALTVLLDAFRAPGYKVGLDLLIRSDERNDFAPDNSLYAKGKDPERGGRRLDELVFEVCTTRNNRRRSTVKAEVLSARGVRRIFCLLLKGGPTAFEWDAASRDWVALAADARIEDAALAEPIPVALLLNPELIPDAVAARMVARDAAPVREARAKSRAEGHAEGRAEGLLQGQRRMLLEALRMRAAVPPAAVARVEVAEADELRRWLGRLLVGEDLSDLLDP